MFVSSSFGVLSSETAVISTVRLSLADQTVSRLVLFPKSVPLVSFPSDPFLILTCLQTAAGRDELAKNGVAV